MVEAAGGVIVRSTPAGDLEVLLIHRPHREDWSLPKGKRDDGESMIECALREVHEETGLECELGDELPTTRYIDRRGRPKVVRYWTMQVAGGSFAPNREVDEVRWIPLDDAAGLLTYDRDVAVVDAVRDAALAFA